MALTGKQLRFLRSKAHHMQPCVQIGGEGVSAPIVRKVTGELNNPELIKIRCNDADRDDVKNYALALEVATAAAVVQVLGKVIILYKRRDKEPDIVLP